MSWPAARKDRFSGAELERYARHIVLRELGGPGQKALRDAKVLEALDTVQRCLRNCN